MILARIMVLKKSKSENSTLFIDASKECVKVTNIDIKALNAEIEQIVAREQVLRDEIAKIIAEVEVEES